MFRNSAEIGAIWWPDGRCGYAITANADHDLLLRIAEIVHQQTSLDGAKAKLLPYWESG